MAGLGCCLGYRQRPREQQRRPEQLGTIQERASLGRAQMLEIGQAAVLLKKKIGDRADSP